MPIQCCYTPQGRTYNEYKRYLQKESEKFVVDENKVAMNLEVAQRMADNAEKKSADMPDEAYVYAMKGAHFLQGMLLKSDQDLRSFNVQKSAIRTVLKKCISIAEDVSKDGGPLCQLHKMMSDEEESQQAMRTSLLEKQFMKGELGEEDLGSLVPKDIDHLNVGEIQKLEDEQRALHEAKRQEVFEKRNAEAIVQKDIFASVLGSGGNKSHMSPTNVVSPLANETAEERIHRMQAKLAGVAYSPPIMNSPPTTIPTHAAIRTETPPQQTINSTPAPPRTQAPPQVAPQQTPPPPQKQVVPHVGPSAITNNFLTFKGRSNETTYAASYGAPAWNYNSAGKHSRSGLRNLGNTCYMNSVLQCLYSIKHFRSAIEEEDYLLDLQFGGNKGRVINSLAEVFRHMSERAGGVSAIVDPSNLKRTLGERNESFAGFSQQDASELFLSLINEVHTDINRPSWFLPPAKEAQQPSTDTNGVSQQQQNDFALSVESARQYFRHNSLNSIVPRTFMLQTRSLTQCNKCGFVSKVINTELGLELPFPDVPLKQNDIVDIETLLKTYCRKERFNASGPNDSKNGYKCSRCNHYVSADRQTTLFSLPKVLTLTLKRFKSYGNFSDKISCCVSFPHTLSIAAYSAVPSTDGTSPSTEFIIQQLKKEQFPNEQTMEVRKSIAGKYRLVGVVNHRGNIHGGHYTADVFDEPRHSWARISDDVCTAADKPDRALAYMLFYEMI